MRLLAAKPTLLLALIFGTLASLSLVTHAITEDENEVSLRDASSTKDRPRIEGYDMDEEVSE